MAGLVVIWAFIGVAGYREAGRFETRNGRAPWGGPPFLWGLVCFLGGLIGALVLFIAMKSTKAKPAATVVWSANQAVDPRYGAPSLYEGRTMPAPDPRYAAPPPDPRYLPPPPPPGAGVRTPDPSGQEFLPRR